MARLAGAGRLRHRHWLFYTATNAAFLLLLWLVERFVGERWWLSALVTCVPQQLFGLPTLWLLAGSVRRKRGQLVVVNAAATVFVAIALMGFNIPLHRAPRVSGPGLRVMTYNIHSGTMGVAGIGEVVRQEHPDVVCLQEADTFRDRPDPFPLLRKEFPQWYFSRSGQLATMSRQPIVRERFFPFHPGAGVLQADLIIGGRRLTVFNTHLSIPIVGISGLTPVRLNRMTQVPDQQVDKLLQVAGGRDACVVAGDFNTPPRGRLDQRLATHWQDCFSVVAWGSGNTFRADVPVIRIDYIWLSPNLRPLNSHVPNVRASDHRPVVADLGFAT